MKAIEIDAAAREIREIEYKGLDDMRRVVGGSICTAWTWRNGDVLYVDDEGLFKPQMHFFRLAMWSDGVPLAGNAIVVGREVEDDSLAGYHTEPPTISVQELRRVVTFLSREQVDAWGKANASEAATTITTVDPSGRVTRDVLSRYGSLYGSIPRPPDEGEN